MLQVSSVHQDAVSSSSDCKIGSSKPITTSLFITTERPLGPRRAPEVLALAYEALSRAAARKVVVVVGATTLGIS